MSMVGGVAKEGQRYAPQEPGADLSEGEGALKAGGLPMGKTDGRGTTLHSGPLVLF